MTKVLYIEHDDDNLYMLKMRLERVGEFEVLAAEDSEKGCKLAATEHPDVMLMDLEKCRSSTAGNRCAPSRPILRPATSRSSACPHMSKRASARRRLPRAATSSMSNRLNSSLGSPPFGGSLQTRNSSSALLGRVLRKS